MDEKLLKIEHELNGRFSIRFTGFLMILSGMLGSVLTYIAMAVRPAVTMMIARLL